jgi:hypothetical protein
MRVLRAVGSFLKNFFIMFSFIVNLFLVVIIIGLLLFIFDIKNNIVTPLVSGLHSSFVGLDEATIDWTIPVRDTIPVVLDIPLQTNTVVTLTEPVPLVVGAAITLPGGAGNLSATVNLTLPEGLELPVALDLNVPVDEELDIALDVRAVIPINQTQLHDPINNLRLTFEPIVRALYNLPSNFGEAGEMVGNILSGQPIDLLAENAYSQDPWPGYGETAGVNYTLGNEPVPISNQPLVTGIVPLGGIPALDQLIRPELYAGSSSPAQNNTRAGENMSLLGIQSYFYDGSFGGVQQTRLQQSITASATAAAQTISPEMMPTAMTLPQETPALPGG